MNAPAVSVRHLSKEYPDARGSNVRACQSVSFEAFPGEIFGVLGTNGAGKTTTLRMLSTVLRPTAGDAVVGGYSIGTNPEAVRKSIGFLSSDTGVYGRLTAQEMMEYFGRLHGLSEAVIAERVQSIAATLDMHEFLTRRCDKLSSGQRQRVNIARTIIHDPPVLIFDEPTAGLDILAASQIVRFVKEARERGRCIVFSTHVMREAEKLCDRLIILHRGMLCAAGTVDELRSQFSQTDLEDIFLDAVAKCGWDLAT
ncbi:ATP-binding cassette domain-containing protein [candidate division KSB1 bacterium]|nr:MAG: ATP-binding cassette domain-containing protein [candidate division KSB1 bacterium]